MNICDNPNKVSVGEDWQENDQVRRSPIIVTGEAGRLFGGPVGGVRLSLPLRATPSTPRAKTHLAR